MRQLAMTRSDRAVLAGGIAAQLLTIGIARFAYTPLMPLMQQQAGLSHQAGAWLGSAIYLGYLTATMTLVVVNRSGARYRLFQACLICAVLTTFAMATTTNIWLWAAVRFLAGASGVGGMLLASEFVLQQLMRSNEDANLGFHFSGLGIGIVLTGIVTMICDGTRWSGQWVVLGYTSLALFLVAWLLVPRPRATRKTVNTRFIVNAHVARRLWVGLFSGAYFTAGWCYAVGATFAVAILTNGNTASISTPSIGWIVIGISAAAGSIASSYIARHLNIQRALIFCYVAQMFALLMLAISDITAFAILGPVLFGATFIAIVSISLTMSALRSPLAPGTAMARMTLSYGAGQIAGPAATALMISHSGNYVPALLTAAVVMALGISCLLAATRL